MHILSHFSCVRLCNPMDCSLPDSSVHGDSPGKNTRVGCHALLQGIFLTQGSNMCLMSSALAGRFFTTSATWEAGKRIEVEIICNYKIYTYLSKCLLVVEGFNFYHYPVSKPLYSPCSTHSCWWVCLQALMSFF